MVVRFAAFCGICNDMNKPWAIRLQGSDHGPEFSKPGALLIRPGDDTCWEDVVERTFFQVDLLICTVERSVFSFISTTFLQDGLQGRSKSCGALNRSKMLVLYSLVQGTRTDLGIILVLVQASRLTPLGQAMLTAPDRVSNFSQGPCVRLGTYSAYFGWANYNDLTRPHPKWWSKQ